MAQATLGIISAFFFDKFCVIFSPKKPFFEFFWFLLYIQLILLTFWKLLLDFLYQKIEGKTPWL
jgi:hypothetical protein